VIVTKGKHMKNFWSFCSFLTLLAILLVDLGARYVNAQASSADKVVNAQEINLVDKKGHKCASLFINGNGEPSLEVSSMQKPGFRATVVTPAGLDVVKGDGDGNGVHQFWLYADAAKMQAKDGKTLWSLPK